MPAQKNAEFSKIVGTHIKAMREKNFPGHGGQTRCASAFGVSQAEWSRWESGSKLPSASTQKKIADFFHVGMDDLWGGKAGGEGGGKSVNLPNADDLAKLLRYYLQIQQRMNVCVGRAVSDLAQYESFLAIMESLVEKLDNLDKNA